jgi:GTP-binding protein
MRREGFELQVWSPQVIFHEERWQKFEPVENVNISVPSGSEWAVIAELWKRKWMMQNMMEENGMINMEFSVPTRWLLGFKSQFTTLTKWEWLISSSFDKYESYKWPIEKRAVGSMISMETGTAMAYSIWNLQDRWTIFIDPATEIYEWMIIWESSKWEDLVVNATKNKKLTNVRASWTDEALRLVPPKIMTLEEAIDYIWNDEYVEITPESIRLRKKYLSETDRKRNERKGG